MGEDDGRLSKTGDGGKKDSKTNIFAGSSGVALLSLKNRKEN